MAENGLLLGGRLRIAVHRRIGLLFQLLRFVFGAVLDGFGLRLGLLGQIVSAVDGVVFDGLGLIHQLLALFAGVILDRGGLGLGVVGDGVGLLGGFIFNRRGFVLQLVCLRGGLFLISSAVAFALSVRSSAFSGRRLSSARRCLWLYRVGVNLGRVITAGNQQPDKGG